MLGNIVLVGGFISLIHLCVTQPTTTFTSVGEFALKTDLCATSGSSTSFVSRSKVSCVNTCQSLVSKLSSCAAVNYRSKAGICEVFNQSPLNYTFLEDDCILYERKATSSLEPFSTTLSTTNAAATTTVLGTSSISTRTPATTQVQATTTPAQNMYFAALSTTGSDSASTTSEIQTCASGIQIVDAASLCTFPFTYNGSVYYSCITNMTGVTSNALNCSYGCIRTGYTAAICRQPANFSTTLVSTNITIQSTSVPVQSVFGWIVMQQRVDLTTSWARNWSHYKSGFGTIGSNYWLGLESVHQLTSAAPYRLRIELQQQSTNKWFSVEYSTFSIGDEVNTRYTLTAAGWASDGFGTQSGDLLKASYDPATDSVYAQYRAVGMKFTTKDRQNDARVGNAALENCATFNNGAWWFRSCYLFCAMCGSTNNDYGAIAPYFYWKQTRMLIKPQ